MAMVGRVLDGPVAGGLRLVDPADRVRVMVALGLEGPELGVLMAGSQALDVRVAGGPRAARRELGARGRVGLTVDSRVPGGRVAVGLRADSRELDVRAVVAPRAVSRELDVRAVVRRL
jgi:hypothetical protein